MRIYVRFLSLAILILAMSAASLAQIGISITFGPPALPVYVQPPCPAAGYIWTPGYWAYDYDDGDYYWVPGTWVLAPQVGYLWTPAWWGWGGDRFIFHEGYWGPQVGFYGGIAYGYGYFGHGYEGGRWEGNEFYYNRTVNNVNVTNVRNVYNTTVINNNTVNRVSYNGGNGGINDRPRPEELAAERERHIPPVAIQKQHEQVARTQPQQRASVNQGKPAIAATPKPGALRDRAAVPAREAGAPYHPPSNHGATAPPRPDNRGGNQPAARTQNNVPRPPAPVPNHAKDIQPHERPAPPNTGNAKVDQKYQQQQNKLYQKQEQDHQRLQQKQEQEHQRLAQRNADAARTQQLEQRHQQQTQQMEQRHAQQQQRLQQRQPAPRPSEPPARPNH